MRYYYSAKLRSIAAGIVIYISSAVIIRLMKRKRNSRSGDRRNAASSVK